jgi:putative oxidoreductase
MTMSVNSGLLILRVVVGLMLAGHGAQKVFGWWGGTGMTAWIGAMNRMRIRPASPWAWASAMAELLGGLAVAIGFLSPLGSFAIAGSMLVAIALVHWPKGFWVSKGGYEFNLLIIATVSALAVIGPGSYSLDHLLGINLTHPLVLIVGTLATVAGVAVALTTRAPQATGETKPQTA